ncbi:MULTISPECIES: DUF429 domain-containing protein [unclassified Modestobacter]
MRTAGIDLAAEPAGTAIVQVVWQPGGAAVVDRVHLRADDAAIVGAVAEADRAAMDCPFGWPEPFVEFVNEHRSGHVSIPTGDAGLVWRRRLSRRETDLRCEQTTGVHPLSVSADRIAAVAMRGAGVLSRLSDEGPDVSRDGSGLVIETYPAAALRSWGLPHKSYKGLAKRDALRASVEALVAAAPKLDLGVAREAIRDSDDVFDALICALIARARVLGLVSLPPAGSETRAGREGWMCLPEQPLMKLFV